MSLFIAHFDNQLLKLLNQAEYFANCPDILHQAIQYSLTNGGKRLRAQLIYTIGQTLGKSLDLLDPLALAVECVHAYSLVHDDLPAMDNDDWRRGKPSCHKQFSESTAILVGDALQSLAFSILNSPTLNSNPPAHRSQSSWILSQAIGPSGMVAGQARDLLNEKNSEIQLDDLILLHAQKTGALWQACCALPALDSEKNIQNSLSEFGRIMGLAFQVQDDYLELSGTLETLGKNPESDLNNQKSTFPKLLGVTGTQKYLDQLWTDAAMQLSEHKNLQAVLLPWLKTLRERQY